MNMLTFGDAREIVMHRVRLISRKLDPRRRVRVVSKEPRQGTLQRVYVINLDRKPDRWKQMQRELGRFRSSDGQSLTGITRRFSAIDARYLTKMPDEDVLKITYTLAEQLMVHPNPLLSISSETQAHEIKMTRQEVAVALSHIEVWKLVANGNVDSALILEDDVVFGPGFASGLERAWSQLTSARGDAAFNLLYLGYRDVGATRAPRSRHVQRRTAPGLWEASGYVLSKEGARNLLALLPAHGPVDLWLNLVFPQIRAYSAPRRVVEQRIDEPSSNSYSVLPILSSVGAITKEKPLKVGTKRLPGPIIATGPPSSGLTAVAMALSMLGYTCVSDLDQLWGMHGGPPSRNHKKARFNAFVNIGSFDEEGLRAAGLLNEEALFIQTGGPPPMTVPAHRVLYLEPTHTDKWAALTSFIGVDYPAFEYPDVVDRGQRSTTFSREFEMPGTKRLQWDRSPWILEGTSADSMRRKIVPSPGLSESMKFWSTGESFENHSWHARNDTFPSNLSLFSPNNVSQEADGTLVLSLREQRSPVRDYSAAAIASDHSHLYGSFSATMQASGIPGVITGFFLHRNGPRQEIDIEILGKDPRTLLANVFFNPGPAGTKLEYGYRGTPVEIDLGFDAAAAPHRYEIVWRPEFIEWRVDGRVVHTRDEWSPTPIPDKPLEVNLNIWTSRSVEFAGRLHREQLPTAVTIHSLGIEPFRLTNTNDAPCNVLEGQTRQLSPRSDAELSTPQGNQSGAGHIHPRLPRDPQDNAGNARAGLFHNDDHHHAG